MSGKSGPGSRSGYEMCQERLASVTQALLDVLDILAESNVNRARNLRADLEQEPLILQSFQWLERRKIGQT